MAGPARNSRETALAVARFLDDHKAAGTVVLDLAGVSPLADFFVIATARSSAHLAGLARELAAALAELGIRPINAHKRTAASGWLLVDCGDVVVHLMEREQREFYDLERLWFRAGTVSYSLKSS
ncbi:MAG: ribosome silencing factor [Spirochaetes bacterium]|nr:ribosome silencing factor [Spirochaetota bacterium]